MTKTEITEKFNLLRVYGYKVAHFNSYHANSKGNIGYPDISIIGHGRIMFCEVKIGKDKLSPPQLEWKAAIQKTAAEYYLIDENNAVTIIEKILKGH